VVNCSQQEKAAAPASFARLTLPRLAICLSEEVVAHERVHTRLQRARRLGAQA
jgi:hypothetical protein